MIKAGSFSPLAFLAADSTSTQPHSPPLSAPISLPKAEKIGGHLQETCLSMQRKELTCGDAEKVTDSPTLPAFYLRSHFKVAPIRDSHELAKPLRAEREHLRHVKGLLSFISAGFRSGL